MFAFGYGTATSATTLNISFVSTQMLMPTCNKCAKCAEAEAVGLRWCKPCLEEENRQRAIAQAEHWLLGAFFAVKKEARARLYKQLAVVFHPDQGGDPALMIALNAVRDRMK